MESTCDPFEQTTNSWIFPSRNMTQNRFACVSRSYTWAKMMWRIFKKVFILGGSQNVIFKKKNQFRPLSLSLSLNLSQKNDAVFFKNKKKWLVLLLALFVSLSLPRYLSLSLALALWI